VRVVACLMLLVSALAHGADASQEQLLQRLRQPAVLRGSFTQERQISGFRRPVQSAGRFVVARGTGLLWHTMRPFESVLVLNQQRLTVSNGTGQPGTTLDATREPMLRTLDELLQSVVVADLKGLQAQFEVELRLPDGADWTMTLQPRQAALRSRFAGIELAGGEYVKSVRLQEQSGDVTTIRFADQMEDSRLTGAEAGQLR